MDLANEIEIVQKEKVGRQQSGEWLLQKWESSKLKKNNNELEERPVMTSVEKERHFLRTKNWLDECQNIFL